MFTKVSSGGTVVNNTACKEKCRAKIMHSFEMQDFYYFADQLNQTNFFDRTTKPNNNTLWRNEPLGRFSN